MLQDVPSTSLVLGDFNASWTLGADTTALRVCRLLESMRNNGLIAVVPRLEQSESDEFVRPLRKNPSTYIVKGFKELPRTGSKGPWRPRSTYIPDLWDTKFGNIPDGLHSEKIPV